MYGDCLFVMAQRLFLDFVWAGSGPKSCDRLECRTIWHIGRGAMMPRFDAGEEQSFDFDRRRGSTASGLRTHLLL
jgi:hypothetical protein